MTAKELNDIMLSFGFAFNTAYTIDVRVTSSMVITTKNTHQIQSNCRQHHIKFHQIALPTSGKLFIVGDATQGGWGNPVPVPTQELARLDETTWAGVFELGWK